MDYKEQRVDLLFNPQGCLTLQLPNLELSSSPFHFSDSLYGEGQYVFLNCSGEVYHRMDTVPCLSGPGFQVLAKRDGFASFNSPDNLLKCRRTLLNLSDTKPNDDLVYNKKGDAIHLSWSQPYCTECEVIGRKCKQKSINNTPGGTECFGTTKKQRGMLSFTRLHA